MQQHFPRLLRRCQVEFATLVTDLRTSVNVVLIPPRRYRKSSLLMGAIEQLRQLDVLTAYVDLERIPSKEPFAAHLARAIHGALSGRAEQALQHPTEWFSQLRIRPGSI